LLPPWSNGLIPLIAMVCCWAVEQRICGKEDQIKYLLTIKLYVPQSTAVGLCQDQTQTGNLKNTLWNFVKVLLGRCGLFLILAAYVITLMSSIYFFPAWLLILIFLLMTVCVILNIHFWYLFSEIQKSKYPLCALLFFVLNIILFLIPLGLQELQTLLNISETSGFPGPLRDWYGFAKLIWANSFLIVGTYLTVGVILD
jgi:hypothetical protein